MCGIGCFPDNRYFAFMGNTVADPKDEGEGEKKGRVGELGRIASAAYIRQRVPVSELGKERKGGDRRPGMNAESATAMCFGDYLRSLRLERHISLRDFAKATQSDPGNISRIERGLLPAPRDRDILGRYARALGLAEGEDVWYRLYDLAASEAGRIPPDLMERDDVVEILPAFFRTIRGQKPTEDDMRKLLDKLKEQR